MADTPINIPSMGLGKRASSPSILLPPLVFLGAMIMAADISAVTLLPLKDLQIPYPGWMEYSYFLIPTACAIVWLLLLRKWPNTGAVVAVLLCFTLLSLIPRYAESRIAEIPVIRWIDSGDLESMERTLDIPLFEQGSSEGNFVIVAPENGQRVCAELARLRLLKPSAAE